jgi:UDP-glucose 4-epimerase
LVIGAAGFLGQRLFGRLPEDSYRARVLDNVATGQRERLEGLEVDVVEGDSAVKVEGTPNILFAARDEGVRCGVLGSPFSVCGA